MVFVKTSTLRGTICVPPSKSHSVRAVILASIAFGKSCIKNVLMSKDMELLIKCCCQFGAQIEKTKEGLEIIGANAFDLKHSVFDVGNSGLAFRLLTALLFHEKAIIMGDLSLKKRPIKPLLRALEQLHKNTIEIDGSDSQYVSALIFAILKLKTPKTISIKNRKEKPFVQMTLSWLKFLQIPYEDTDKKITIYPKGSIEAFDYTVPTDFSSASYPIAAALLTGSIQIEHLDFSDSQGDKQLIDCFQKMGGDIEIKGQSVVAKKSELEGIEIDCDPFIDALPQLAVLGCFAKGKTRLYNAKSARFKECDRIACVAKELKKLGANIEEKEDGFIVYESAMQSGVCHSYLDHRLALSFIVLGLRVGDIEIKDIDCMKKTYPQFIERLEKCGACFEKKLDFVGI
ncbi:MAG: 3-phosphoshikimate 1-carboxyvinyltransferase [Chlamydiae bacterium]|nr:3-phosphoshikimate 1-carboxyvinyltransferase [Chlamydiota bacterium]